jgi:rhodanese-related sulfurtransferase
MKKVVVMMWVVVIALSVAAPEVSAADDMAAKLNAIMAKSTEVRFWQFSAEDVNAMIKEQKTDFLVVDARPRTSDFAEGHIPGAIHIMTQDMFKPESLKKLPKNKKLILVCATGQIQNLPVIGLRMLGYDAYVMAFGYAAWIKGYGAGVRMQDAVKAANYPVVK